MPWIGNGTIDKESPSDINMPPSGIDMTEAIKMLYKYRNEEAAEKFRWTIVGPGGIWEYSVDIGHPVIKKTHAIMTEINAISLRIATDQSLIAFFQKNPEAKKLHPVVLLQTLEASPDIRETVKKSLQESKRLEADTLIDKNIGELNSRIIKTSPSPGATEATQKLIERYKEKGIALTFTPFGR